MIFYSCNVPHLAMPAYLYLSTARRNDGRWVTRFKNPPAGLDSATPFPAGILGRGAAEQRRQFTDVRGTLQSRHERDHRIGLAARPVGVFRAAAEFHGRFLEAHRIGGASFAENRPPRNHLAVLECNFDDGSHLV